MIDTSNKVPTAHELKEELKAALIDGAPHRATGWEWAQAVDRIVEAARSESQSAAEGGGATGDARDRLEALLVASYGEVSDMDAFVDEMSRYGIYVLTRSDYDELVKRRRTTDDTAIGCVADAAYCARENPFANHVNFERFKQELADRGVIVTFAAIRGAGGK